MSLINRIEVANILNQQKGSIEWNPKIDHAILDFGGHSTVFQMANGDGKTTLTEGLTALLSRHDDRLRVIQQRMAYDGISSPSHIRLELVSPHSNQKDILTTTLNEPVKGEPWVLGMYGFLKGAINFYTYQGRLEDAPVIQKKSETEIVYSSIRQLEDAVMGTGVKDGEIDISRERWKKKIVSRHLDPEAVDEIRKLSEQGGAEKVIDFFNISDKNEDFDAAFFYSQIAGDLIDDLMGSEGEEEEKFQSRKDKTRHVSDKKFENHVLKSAISIVETEAEIQDNKDCITAKGKALTSLQQVIPLCENVTTHLNQLAEIEETIFENNEILRWLLSGNMPGFPKIETQEDLLSKILINLGLTQDMEIVITANGCGNLLGKNTGYVGKQMMRWNKRPLQNLQVIEIPRNVVHGPQQGGSHEIKWYNLEALRFAITRTEELADGLSKDTATTLLNDAEELAIQAFGEANPFLNKLLSYDDSIHKIKENKKLYEKLIQDALISWTDKQKDAAEALKAHESVLIGLRNQKNKYDNFLAEHPKVDPVTFYEEINAQWKKQNHFSSSIEEKLTAQNERLTSLNENSSALKADKKVEEIYQYLASQKIPFTTVHSFLEENREEVDKEHFNKVATYLGTLFSAPVLKDITSAIQTAEYIASLNIPIPVIFENELTLLLAGDLNLDIKTVDAFTYGIFGSSITPTVKAFLEPSNNEELISQIETNIEELEAQKTTIDDKLGEIEKELTGAKEASLFITTNVEQRLTEAEKTHSALESKSREADRYLSQLRMAFQDQDAARNDLSETDKDYLQNYWRQFKALDAIKSNRQPWETAFKELFNLCIIFQNTYSDAFMLKRRLELTKKTDIHFDPYTDHVLLAANQLKEGINECLKSGTSLYDACSLMRAKADSLSLKTVENSHKNKLTEIDLEYKSILTTLDTITSAYKDHLSDLLTATLLECYNKPVLLIQHIEDFKQTHADEISINKQSEENAASQKTETVKALAARLRHVRSRKRLLDKALSEGNGTSFEVEVTIPSNDNASNVFAGVLSMVEKQRRKLRTDYPDLNDDDFRTKLQTKIRPKIRDTLMQKILIDPHVYVIHEKFNKVRRKLESPSSNNPNRFSNGENTAISLTWMIRKARYARDRGLLNKGYKASEMNQIRQNSSSFIILDGLFSDLSDEVMIRQSMEPLIQMKGEFQIFALVHSPDYIRRHDSQIFPRLIMGGLRGGRWQIENPEPNRNGTWDTAHIHVEDKE